jgi:hypothetical protein
MSKELDANAEGKKIQQKLNSDLKYEYEHGACFAKGDKTCLGNLDYDMLPLFKEFQSMTPAKLNSVVKSMESSWDTPAHAFRNGFGQVVGVSLSAEAHSTDLRRDNFSANAFSFVRIQPKEAGGDSQATFSPQSEAQLIKDLLGTACGGRTKTQQRVIRHTISEELKRLTPQQLDATRASLDSAPPWAPPPQYKMDVTYSASRIPVGLKIMWHNTSTDPYQTDLAMKLPRL